MKKIIFDLDDTLYRNELRLEREKAILNFLDCKKEKYLELKKNHGTIESLNILGVNKKQFFDIMDNVPIEIKKDEKLIKILEKIGKNYELIVLSNSSEFCVREVLTKLGIIQLINKYYHGENFENQKPNEECFFMVESRDICVGNSFRKDLEIPKKLGAITILVGEKENPNADFTIRNIYELEKIMKSIENI
ncbi:Haloacid dehalogenase-like hydrolase [uncultured archaeon]|nr:Haloacid dehalogenase-like hydrolase [uncultured archaeon]